MTNNSLSSPLVSEPLYLEKIQRSPSSSPSSTKKDIFFQEKRLSRQHNVELSKTRDFRYNKGLQPPLSTLVSKDEPEEKDINNQKKLDNEDEKEVIFLYYLC